MGLRDELMAIRHEFGELTPINVVTAASDANHPLHDNFEWDDSVAGPKYRESQARELIRSVRISFVGKNGPARVRQFIATRDGTPSAYRPIEEVVQDPIASEILLREMRRDWAIFKRRYQDLTEFVELVRSETAIAS